MTCPDSEEERHFGDPELGSILRAAPLGRQDRRPLAGRRGTAAEDKVRKCPRRLPLGVQAAHVEQSCLRVERGGPTGCGSPRVHRCSSSDVAPVGLLSVSTDLATQQSPHGR